MKQAFIVSLCATVLASGCATQPAKKMALPTAEEGCIKLGGKWLGGASVDSFYCLIQTSDGGKKCSDSSECEGSCLAVKAVGEAAFHGKCSQDVSVPGLDCSRHFEGGKVQRPGPCA